MGYNAAQTKISKRQGQTYVAEIKITHRYPSFCKAHQENCYYVDKTALAWQLIQDGSYVFLSRLRRFGKSLLLYIPKEPFENNEPLFRGLFIHDKWNWSKNLSESNAEDIAGRFSDLIRNAHQQYQTLAVVLINEYDKPILDNITNPNATAETRECLKNLYPVINDADPYLRFCLLTGVSKFSKVSLFSGLNNSNYISMDAKFSAICGYTDGDIDRIFAPDCPAWIALKFAAGITVTAGTENLSTILFMHYCSFKNANLNPIGLKARRRLF